MAQTKPTSTEGKLNRPDQITHDHVGQYCIVLYDEKLYPGEIRNIVSHGDAKLMRDGRVDINKYPEEDILCLIPESLRTSKRYTSLEEGLWNKIETLYGK